MADHFNTPEENKEYGQFLMLFTQKQSCAGIYQLYLKQGLNEADAKAKVKKYLGKYVDARKAKIAADNKKALISIGAGIIAFIVLTMLASAGGRSRSGSGLLIAVLFGGYGAYVFISNVNESSKIDNFIQANKKYFQ